MRYLRQMALMAAALAVLGAFGCGGGSGVTDRSRVLSGTITWPASVTPTGTPTLRVRELRDGVGAAPNVLATGTVDPSTGVYQVEGVPDGATVVVEAVASTTGGTAVLSTVVVPGARRRSGSPLDISGATTIASHAIQTALTTGAFTVAAITQERIDILTTAAAAQAANPKYTDPNSIKAVAVQVLNATNNGTVPTGPKKWTFMVYMDGDNDLEDFGVLNMNQMESIGSDANINIVVQFDRTPGWDQTNGDWTDTRRFLVTKDDDTRTITSPVLQNLGEVDMGDPAVLQEFITWATTNYPAERYVLVPWNHGGGWRSRMGPASGTKARSRGILYDDSGNPDLFRGTTFMTMGQFNSAMTVPGVHFDIIAIDCSLMGMLEVAYEIRDRADYICASEESPPGAGYPYHSILSDLASNPSMSTEQFARTIMNRYVESYGTEGVTQAVIKTSGLPLLAQRMNALGTALLGARPTYDMNIAQAYSGTQSYAYSYYRDIHHLASNLKAGIGLASVQSAADGVMQALQTNANGPIVAERHNGSSVTNSHGLSIYAPSNSIQLYPGYSDLQFCKDHPAWNEFMQAFATR